MNLEQNKFLRFQINPSFMKFQKNKKEKENEIMKRIKKIASLLLAMVMVFAMSVTAFATDADSNTGVKDKDKFTLTINDSTPGYEYSAYQIFKANVDKRDGTLSDIEWGDAIDTSKLQKVFATEDAKDVAKALENQTYDSDVAKEYAAKFAKCMKRTTEDENGNLKHDKTIASGISVYADNSYTISNLTPGYYLVLNESISEDNSTEDSFTRYILNVVQINGDIGVSPKRGDVTSDKDVVDDVEGAVKRNEAPVGQEMTFRLWAKLPQNYSSYKEYYLKFKDYLTKGLTASKESIKIYAVKAANATVVGDDGKETVIIPENGMEGVVDLTTVDPKTGFYKDVATETMKHPTKNTDVFKLTVGTQNLKWYDQVGNIEDGDYIMVVYTAHLNENAIIGIDGNDNYVTVEHDNDPNNSGGGTITPPDQPEEPTPKHPTGETPESKTTTYTTELTITKIDGDTKAILPGAGFTLTGTGVEVHLVATEVFEENAEGAYWKLAKQTADGKDLYTTVAPIITDEANNVVGNESDYADIETKYTKKTLLVKDGTPGNYSVQGIINEGGYVTFTGLGEGKYTLEETIVPSGYNKMEKQEFEISFDSSKPEFSIKVTKGTAITPLDGQTGFGFSTDIENNKGSLLPSTGGIGTTIFYVVGGILVIGAGILLVTKRRMKAQ